MAVYLYAHVFMCLPSAPTSIFLASICGLRCPERILFLWIETHTQCEHSNRHIPQLPGPPFEKEKLAKTQVVLELVHPSHPIPLSLPLCPAALPIIPGKAIIRAPGSNSGRGFTIVRLSSPAFWSVKTAAAFISPSISVTLSACHQSGSGFRCLLFLFHLGGHFHSTSRRLQATFAGRALR